jgi:hypothetical protein
MSVGEWIDIPTVKALTQHASATLAALTLFGVVRVVLDAVVLSNKTRTILEFLDEFVLLGLFVWLIYQMACLLWKGRMKNAATNLVMVA